MIEGTPSIVRLMIRFFKPFKFWDFKKIGHARLFAVYPLGLLSKLFHVVSLVRSIVKLTGWGSKLSEILIQDQTSIR